MTYPQYEDEQSPTWVTGSVVSALTYALSLVGIFAFGWSLVEITPWLAVILMAIILGGSAPTVWRYRERPVLRWVIYGLAAGVASGGVLLILALLFTP